MKIGECLFFDPRILHGAYENDSDETRVSVDFRIVYMRDYSNIISFYEKEGNTVRDYDGNPLKTGGYYFGKSAKEISENLGQCRNDFVS